MGKNKTCYIYIALAGVIWSTLGLFGSILMSGGLSSEQVAFIRLFIGCIVLAIYSAIRKPELLKISKKGLLYCMAAGVMGQGLFNMSYFKSVELVGVSIAVVLSYTSPLFLALFSRIIYGEKITPVKMVSLILCFVGSVMAVTGGRLDLSGLNVYGLIMGVVSAIAYALIPTISKNALKEISSETLLIYSFMFGAIFMIPSAKPIEMLKFATDMNVMPYMLLLGMFPAAIAYILYATGISRGAELSVVGVVASTELIGGTLIGWILIGEPFSIGKIIGVAIMIISTITAVNANKENAEDGAVEIPCVNVLNEA